MPDKAWKAFERRIAKSLGTDRTPLSGGASRHTRSDTLHPDLYVECRARKALALHEPFLEVSGNAHEESKVPIMALHKKGTRTTLAVIDWDFFLELWDCHCRWLIEENWFHEDPMP